MRANYKVPQDVRDRMSRELYTYWENVRELKQIVIDIIDSTPKRDNSGIKSKYQVGKPTEQKALKIVDKMSTRAYIIAMRRIAYIENAMKKLNNYDKEVVEYIFRDGDSQVRAEVKHGISKDVYYNVKNKIIYYVALEFGEI